MSWTNRAEPGGRKGSIKVYLGNRSESENWKGERETRTGVRKKEGGTVTEHLSYEWWHLQRPRASLWRQKSDKKPTKHTHTQTHSSLTYNTSTTHHNLTTSTSSALTHTSGDSCSVSILFLFVVIILERNVTSSLITDYNYTEAIFIYNKKHMNKMNL